VKKELYDAKMAEAVLKSIEKAREEAILKFMMDCGVHIEAKPPKKEGGLPKRKVTVDDMKQFLGKLK
jgi:hypothetical protein